MRREVAWRVFASEYNASYHVVRGGSDKEPTYVLTPLGALVNRLFIVGILVDREEVGEDGGLYRGRLSDPTGVYYISAGRFQPEASKVLGSAEIPSYLAVVGKCRVYSPDEETLYLSVRAERVRIADRWVRDRWTLRAAQDTLQRIEAMEMAMDINATEPASLVSAGIPSRLARGVVKALDIYGRVDLSRYRAIVADALRFMLVGREGEEVFEESYEEEKIILEILQEMGSESEINYRDILDAATARGIKHSIIDEIIDSLIRRNVIEEVLPGIIRLKVPKGIG
ncbi:MAG: hypothetical protein DRN20_02510 [Thermoplasmata archaeon]|nr:MAG: hypothetical protein DRN20_02510 [Thermoplasmata archaeon]